MFSQSMKTAKSSVIELVSLSRREARVTGPPRVIYTLYFSRKGIAVWARVSSSSSASTHRSLSSAPCGTSRSKAATMVAGPSSPLSQTEYSADSSSTSPSSSVIRILARRSPSAACSQPSNSLQLSARTRAVHSTTPSQVLSLSKYHLAVRGHAGQRIGLVDDLFQRKLFTARVLSCAMGGDDLSDGAHRVARPEIHHSHAPGTPALTGNR